MYTFRAIYQLLEEGGGGGGGGGVGAVAMGPHLYLDPPMHI